MSNAVETTEGPSDTDLLAAVRAGDEAAYGQLWARHEAAAHRFARQLTRPSNVDDLVSESFYRILRTIKNGHGPETAFRPYLFSTMRRYLIDNARAYDQRVVLTGDDSDLDGDSAPGPDDLVAATVEQQAALAAWSSLPEASRTLLWHLLIEEETPAAIAPLLGTTANGVSSRAVRAKERLRQAFLSQQLARADNRECRTVRELLGGYVRDALSARDRLLVEAHLDDCEGCRAALAEATDVNLTLRAVVLPLLLGGSALAAKYLAATHAAAAGAATGEGAAALGVGARLARAGRHLATLSKSATTIVAAGTVAVAGAAAFALAAQSSHTPAPTAAAQTSIGLSAPAARPTTAGSKPARPASSAAAPPVQRRATPAVSTHSVPEAAPVGQPASAPRPGPATSGLTPGAAPLHPVRPRSSPRPAGSTPPPKPSPSPSPTTPAPTTPSPTAPSPTAPSPTTPAPSSSSAPRPPVTTADVGPISIRASGAVGVLAPSGWRLAGASINGHQVPVLTLGPVSLIRAAAGDQLSLQLTSTSGRSGTLRVVVPPYTATPPFTHVQTYPLP